MRLRQLSHARWVFVRFFISAAAAAAAAALAAWLVARGRSLPEPPASWSDGLSSLPAVDLRFRFAGGADADIGDGAVEDLGVGVPCGGGAPYIAMGWGAYGA